jgi:glycine betaine/proline transport system permease protein
MHFRPVFQGIRVPVDYILSAFQQLMLGMPAPVAIILFSLIAWQFPASGWARHADFADCHRRHRRLVAGDGDPGAGADRPAVLYADRPAAGDLAGASPRAAKIIRPLLDAMQTTPAFVYLVPIVMLFGIGNVPGVVVTIIFALPPIVRLTILGINQVPADLIEASRSFGASPRQLLFKVQLRWRCRPSWPGLTRR